MSHESEHHGTSSTLYSCDACNSAFFHTKEQLEEHVVSRHSAELFQDYSTLLMAGRTAHAQWSSLKNVPSVTEKLEQWGEKAFQLAAQRDGGEEKMREAHAARAQLEVAVKRWLPTCSVYIFGSSVALGVWDGSSDIDFTVVDVHALEGGAWAPNEKGAVRSIAQVLFRAGFAPSNLEMIPFARVPIVKHHANTPLIPATALEALGQRCKAAEKVVARSARITLAAAASPHDRVLLEASLRSSCSTPDAVEQLWWDRRATTLSATFCDTTECVRALTSPLVTSPNNRIGKVEPLHVEYRPELFQIDFDMSFRVFGIRNSLLLRKYLLAHPCGRPGSLVLKDWSKTSGVNNSLGGFFTSYAVNILWIYYLVRTGYVPYLDPLDIPASLAHPDHSPDPHYVPMRPSDAETPMALMGELLVGFFRFYAFEFDWDNHVVSLNRHEVTTKEELGWAREEVSPGRRHTRYALCIEDPYEEMLNLGRHIGPTKAKRVLQEFTRGFLSLIKDDANESCVFEMSDNANTDDLLPPAAAILELMTTCMVIFEEKATSEAKHLHDGSESVSSPKKKKEGMQTIGSNELKNELQQRCPNALSLALRCWSFPQLTFRLGYKCIGGVVYRRGTFTAAAGSGSSDTLHRRDGTLSASQAAEAASLDAQGGLTHVQSYLAAKAASLEEQRASMHRVVSAATSHWQQTQPPTFSVGCIAPPADDVARPACRNLRGISHSALPSKPPVTRGCVVPPLGSAITPEALARRLLSRR